VRYLADENIPLAAVERLRAEGIDIASVAKLLAGQTDARVLEEANRDGRIVITFDKDFAELVFRDGRDVVAGVILLRVRPRSASEIAATLASLLTSGRDWQGHFSVVDDRHIRMVPLSRARQPG
jgi:predicted nuclease of predicted toxin-antitoxin system